MKNYLIIILCVFVVSACKVQENPNSTPPPPSTPTPSSSNMTLYGYQDQILYSFQYNESIKKDNYGNTVSLGIYGKRYKQYAIDLDGVTNIDSTRIGFDSSLSSNVLGVCYMGQNKILINPSFWFSKYTTNSKREIVLFHELGHCLLGRLHDNDEVYSIDTSDIMEKSIMNSYVISYNQYENNHNYYVNELFDSSFNSIGLYANNANQFNNGFYGVLDRNYNNYNELKTMDKGLPIHQNEECIVYE